MRGNPNLIKEGHFTCECGREFVKSQSLYAHQSHCKTHLGDRYSKEKHESNHRIGDHLGWSKGLTKETDLRVKSYADTLKGRVGSFTGKTHTQDTRQKMAVRAKYNAEHHLNGWKSGNNRLPNKYESFTEKFLKQQEISYLREFVLPKSQLGNTTGSYYQLDFLINNTIDLEIDGSSHDSTYDEVRDSYVSKRYIVYRINHHDSIEELEIKLNEFIKTL